MSTDKLSPRNARTERQIIGLQSDNHSTKKFWTITNSTITYTNAIIAARFG
jgi:hypothetical protein